MEMSGQPRPLYPGERARGTLWIGGWVGSKAGLDAVEKRKILSCRESNPGRPVCSPSLYRLPPAVEIAPLSRSRTNSFMNFVTALRSVLLVLQIPSFCTGGDRQESCGFPSGRRRCLICSLTHCHVQNKISKIAHL
jgi:hypothetical protein